LGESRGDRRIKGDGTRGGKGEVTGSGEAATFGDECPAFESFSLCDSDLSTTVFSSEPSTLGMGMLDISVFGADSGDKNSLEISVGSTGDGSLLAWASSRDREEGPAPALEAVAALGLAGMAVIPSRISGSSSCFG
jgi:hypothetical protein